MTVDREAPKLPAVSILMVARNTAPFIGDAILTARRQSLADIEIIVVDDGSTDGTRAIAENHAAMDARVRVLDGPGEGLAAARNASLAAARGCRGIILDSDDMLHPDHVATLLAAAERTGAQMVASNMVEFVEGDEWRSARIFAQGRLWAQEREIGLAAFLEANRLFAGAPSLGYLKPMFDMDFLRAKGLRYAKGLRIGEDFDLALRGMLAGARMLYLPGATYFYRRHAASTSAHLPIADIAALIESDRHYAMPSDPKVRRARESRRSSLMAALRHAHAVDAIKARRPGEAFRALAGNGLAMRLLLGSFVEAVAKRVNRRLMQSRKEVRPGRVALVIGALSTECRAAKLAERLVRTGSRLFHRQVPESGREACLSDRLPMPDVIILADEAARNCVSYALAPHATLILADGRRITHADVPA